MIDECSDVLIKQFKFQLSLFTWVMSKLGDGVDGDVNLSNTFKYI